jgi:hypothetical protein
MRMFRARVSADGGRAFSEDSTGFLAATGACLERACVVGFGVWSTLTAGFRLRADAGGMDAFLALVFSTLIVGLGASFDNARRWTITLGRKRSGTFSCFTTTVGLCSWRGDTAGDTGKVEVPFDGDLRAETGVLGSVRGVLGELTW